jgi:phage-related protein
LECLLHEQWEIGAKGAEGIGRAFFCTVKGRKVIVLHAFIKKSAKTPKQDLDLALKRMAEVNQDG